MTTSFESQTTKIIPKRIPFPSVSVGAFQRQPRLPVFPEPRVLETYCVAAGIDFGELPLNVLCELLFYFVFPFFL